MEKVERKYINPFTDYGFKHIFGSEETKPFLIDFLNELMRNQVGFEQIIDISYKDKELPKVSSEERDSIFHTYKHGNYEYNAFHQHRSDIHAA